MIIRKYLTLLVICFTCLINITCSNVRKTRKATVRDFEWCFVDSVTNISDKINVKGYYQVNRNTTYREVFDDVLFFENGIVVTNFPVYRPEKNFEESIVSFLTHVSQSPNSNEAFAFKRSSLWGGYTIIGDTIIASVVNKPYRGAMEGVEVIIQAKFVILNNKLLEVVSRSTLIPSDKTGGHYTKINRESGVARFVSLDHVPPSDGWPLYEEWFWCDELEYQDWKIKNGIPENQQKYK